MVRRLEARRLCRSLHGTGGRSQNLHDQLAVRRFGAARLGSRLQRRCALLARENQHELAVQARKFRNLHIFGLWWFMNVPELINETTRMRLELLGPTFTAQHSDARVLDQIIYKWDHSRQIIGEVLADKYAD